MRRYVTALAILTLVTMNGAATRADLTYNIVNHVADQNGYSLTGTITTNGATGALTAANFVSWQFTITGTLGSFSTSGTVPLLDIGVTATLSTLSTSSQFALDGFNGPPAINTPSLEVQWRADLPIYQGAENVQGDTFWVTSGTGFGTSGAWTVATVAAVPEPSTFTVAALAGVCGIACGLARKRWAQRAASASAK
jgi:hypothetical protein